MNRSTIGAKGPLELYRHKRDFSKTPEPTGRRARRPPGRRFVVQKHAARRLHFDFRIEWDGVFKSWALTKGPSLNPADKRLAVQVEDHPLGYGDFEGTIPKGQYGGGIVQLWDRGEWMPVGDAAPAAALKSGELKFQLHGERLRGGWVLVRIKNDRSASAGANWLLIKHRDAEADDRGEKTEALLHLDRSVATGRTMQQIAVGVAAETERPRSNTRSRKRSAAIPGFVEPQLCELVARPPMAPGWVHELKFDGYRAQLRVSGGRVTIRTRRGLDWTRRFAAIAAAARLLPECLIDGEIVVLDREQVSSFASLQAVLAGDADGMLVLFAFDLLFDGRQDLRELPLAHRKRRLRELLKPAALQARIRYVEDFESDADAAIQSACRLGYEGIVSKQRDTPYVSGRSGAWTKTKCRAGQEVVLGGWSTFRGGFRSLLAGVHRGGELVYVGRIGTGYGRDVVARLLPKLRAQRQNRSPFTGSKAPRSDADVHWLKPTLVAEIEFAGWTATGMLRQAAFKGLREDKPAVEIDREAAEPVLGRKRRRPSTSRRAATPSPRMGTAATGTHLSHPDKVLWPATGPMRALTKSDLAAYFENIADWMLPHVAHRPCSLLRAPDGIDGGMFFQRHAGVGAPSAIETVRVRGERARYLRIDQPAALAAAAQWAALELHPWNCAQDAPEIAGRLVFDLDPADGLPFTAVIAAALEVRERLETLGLSAYCKTSGGKGLHVVSPLLTGKAAVRWPLAKNFAHLLCTQMTQDSPTRYVVTPSKQQREGKLFLDYLRNDRTATAVAVLSPRARPGALISMPLNWSAVRPGLEPRAFTLLSAPALLRKTKPWTGYVSAARALRPAALRLSRKGA